MSARRWWLAGGLQGGLSGEYHYVKPESGGLEAACGIRSIGWFVKCTETSAERARRRCQRCVDRRTPETLAIGSELKKDSNG